MKYVLVSGGVISGVGKGIIASSTGLLLKTMGLKVDPYLNVDAGTMNPKEHGEVFVLDDGGEVDLDLGNYERYLNITLTRENNITTGKVYQHVIERERRGDYLGRTVQVVPHITDAIHAWIERVAKIPVDDTKEQPDVCIIELGGTVGDIESMPFIEAMTQLRRTAGRDNFLQIHVSYIPLIHGEQKTKPTQQAIRAVRSAGLFPDLIACRCERSLEDATVDKIAHFCHVDSEQVVVVRDMPSIYQVPVLLEQQGLLPLLQSKLRLDRSTIPTALVSKGQQIWESWKALTMGPEHRYYEPVNIALVGKYTEFHDSYTSVIKALEHSAMRCRRALKILWVDSEHLESTMCEKDPAKYHKAWHETCTADGILVPGGFGVRGTEGMIAAARWARENKRPFLGICLGMQVAVIEYARNVCKFTNATSAEFIEKKKQQQEKQQKQMSVRDSAIPTPIEPVAAPLNPPAPVDASGADEEHAVIAFMPEIDPETLGGTMRLGLRQTLFQPGSEWSKMRALYGDRDIIWERHRHRYEVSPAYIARIEDHEPNAGLSFVGKDEDGDRMEIVEIREHPFFVGVQFHPEYLSRVLDPSRPYLGLVAASSGCLDEITQLQLKMARDRTANGVQQGF